MAKMKGTSRVVWMGDEEIKMLQALSETVDLPQTQMLSRIVAAGLRAINQNNNRIEFPLVFRTVGHLEAVSPAAARYQLNEPDPQPHSKKR